MEIDRDKAAVAGRLGASRSRTPSISAYGSRQVSTIYAPNNQYQVILELLPRVPDATRRPSPCSTSAPSTGSWCRCHAVARLTPRRRPAHSSTTSASSRRSPSRSTCGRASPWATRCPRSTRWPARPCPATITTSFQGTAQAFQSSLKGLGLLLLMAILVIYIVLGILYESFIHPLTILSGLPSAGSARCSTLLLFRHGPEPLRLRRHHHADRHREEERHHDDRLRPGGRAQGGKGARRGDPSRAASSASGRS